MKNIVLAVAIVIAGVLVSGSFLLHAGAELGPVAKAVGVERADPSHERHVACLQGGGEWVGIRCKRPALLNDQRLFELQKVCVAGITSKTGAIPRAALFCGAEKLLPILNPAGGG